MGCWEVLRMAGSGLREKLPQRGSKGWNPSSEAPGFDARHRLLSISLEHRSPSPPAPDLHHTGCCPRQGLQQPGTLTGALPTTPHRKFWETPPQGSPALLQKGSRVSQGGLQGNRAAFLGCQGGTGSEVCWVAEVILIKS